MTSSAGSLETSANSRPPPPPLPPPPLSPPPPPPPTPPPPPPPPAKAHSPSPSPSSPIPVAGDGGGATGGDAGTTVSPARSPSPLPLPAPPPSSSSRRLPPPCWTHEETLALIDSYREKWYALRRGNLRAPHWQEVADAVARRSLRLPAATPKTSVQCRHKVEKLRKRYRAERQRSLAQDSAAPPTSSWVYFHKMDAMEHAGPAPPPSSSEDDPSDSSDDDHARPHGGSGGGNTRSLHRLLSNGGGSGSRSGGGMMGGGLRFTVPKAVRSKIDRVAAPGPSQNFNPNTRFFKGYGLRPAAEEMRRRMERKRKKMREKERESDAAGELVSALRMLGDGFMRMEQMKMQMAREMEKVRMEMELKRTEMLLDSQRCIIDTFVKGLFGVKKRAKVSPES